MDRPELPFGFTWIEQFPAPEEVDRLLIVPFDDGICAAGARAGDLFFPEWRRGDEGKTYFEGAYLAPLNQIGFRYQQLHPFAAKPGPDGLLVVGWEHGELRETGAERVVETSDAMAARLHEQGQDDLARLCEVAFHSFSNQGEDTYFADNKAVLERAYLQATTPVGGSGSSGDDANWELTRRLHVEAIKSDGSYLDTGCANGLLMESMVKWAAEEGYWLDPYGVDISEKLVEVAAQDFLSGPITFTLAT